MKKMVFIEYQDEVDNRYWFYEAPENVKEDEVSVYIWDGKKWREFVNALMYEVIELKREVIKKYYNGDILKVTFKDGNDIVEAYIARSYYQGSINNLYWSLEELEENESY